MTTPAPEHPALTGRVANADLYRTIARELPHGAVFVVDAGLRYVLADGSGLRAAGFEPYHFEGRTVREAAPPALAEQQEADYLGVLGGASFSREHEINRRHYHSYGVPLNGAGGTPELAFVVSYDITDRVRAERQLKVFSELGDITRAATDQALTVAAVADLLRRHLGCSHAYVAEADHEAMQLRELSDLLTARGLAPAQPWSILGTGVAARLLEGRAACSTQLDGLARSSLLAQAGAVSCLVCPCMRGAHLVGVVAVFKGEAGPWDDDTEALLRAVADKTWDAIERCQSLASLRAADEHKTRVLAVLGHELRSPLAALLPAMQLLQRAQGTPPASIMRLMTRQLGQLNHLVDDLLSLSYICFGKLELHRERVAIDDVVEAAADAQRPLAERKRQRIEIDLPDTPLWLDADRAKLVQVLSNLIGNAVKYTPPEGLVRVEARGAGDKLALSVSDNGIGMGAEAVARMFELFVRGAPAAHAHARAQEPDENGLGIGLWVVRQLVLAHGGEIDATSPGDGLGSRFTVELPLAPPPSA